MPPEVAPGRSVIRIGRADEFPPGQPRVVFAGRLEVGVYNVDGQLYAIRNFCPHRGAPVCLGTVGGTMLPSDHGQLEYGLEERVVKCPWHRWEFDVTTGQLLFRDEKLRLVQYELTEQDGDVYVTVPTRLAEQAPPLRSRPASAPPE